MLYGVTTKRLNEQVRRNRERFPEDFLFQLTREEYEALRSQFATLKPGRGRRGRGRRWRRWQGSERVQLLVPSTESVRLTARSSGPLARVGLSAKVLNDCLRRLVEFRVLEKRSYPEIPPRVEHGLTAFGRKFRKTLNATWPRGRQA